MAFFRRRHGRDHLASLLQKRRTLKQPLVSRSFLIAPTSVPVNSMEPTTSSPGKRWGSIGNRAANNRNSLHKRASSNRMLRPTLRALDLDRIGPVFVPYTVTDADLASVGPLPSSVAAQAKLKFLPYRDAADAIAEKFHSNVHLLEQLNPGKMKTIKAGDQLMVPNVEPFELAWVKKIKPGSEVALQAANEIEDQPDAQAGTPEEHRGATANVVIKIDTKANTLEVYEGEKLIAAYPVTVGSAQTVSPIGEWKVRRITKMATFRYDKEMLKHGQRSGNFYLLPPGPRNPVGVMWIALNKKGIGIHGTNSPDSIGHAASHGCIRLANWDVVRLATKIKPGDKVSIH